MSQLLRLFTILRTIARFRLLELLPKHIVSKPVRMLVWLCGIGVEDKSAGGLQNGARLRLALQTLGPIHIKFGQLLSTRRDMLPEEVADELARLQDQVAPFSGKSAIDIIEKQLGADSNSVFQQLDSKPLASASLAQVHAAKLLDGSDVVVKVLRPDIEKTIEADLKLLSLIASNLERHSEAARRLRLTELVADYRQVIFAELDFKQEAANSSLLKRNFEQDEQLKTLLYVPAVHWDYSTDKVLVMERVYGVPISNLKVLNEKNTNLKLLAERGVEIFFTQVFEHNFFHADMHPGNIFVDTSNPDDPRYIALDCAIMGSLSETDRYYTARILLGALDRDYALVTRMYLDSGWLKAGTNARAFENLIRSVCEPIFSKPLAELSFGTLLVYLFQAAKRFGMEVQPSLVLLQKTLVNVEGLGQQLYPQLDLWETAQPFLSRWVDENYSTRGLAKQLQDKAPELLDSLPLLPTRLAAMLHQFNPGRSGEHHYLHDRLERLEAELQRHRKFNVILALITVVWVTAFLINI